VAFNATVNKKSTTFAQHRDITTLTFAGPGQLRCDGRRRKACRSATAKIDKANEPYGDDRESSHFRDQFQKLFALGNPAHLLCQSLARAR